MTQSNPSNLDYAPPPPMHQRRSFRRGLFALVAMLLLLVLVPLVTRGIQHARLLYWQHRCMNAMRSSDTVVWKPAETFSATPEAAWTNFYTLLSPPGGAPWSTALLHGRDAGSGQRLVAVDLFYHPGDQGPALHSRVFVSGTLTRRPLEAGGAFEVLRLQQRATKFFAGQPDPADPSHFTIDYTDTDNQRHTLDGWLLPDDTVVIEPRPSATE